MKCVPPLPPMRKVSMGNILNVRAREWSTSPADLNTFFFWMGMGGGGGVVFNFFGMKGRYAMSRSHPQGKLAVSASNGMRALGCRREAPKSYGCSSSLHYPCPPREYRGVMSHESHCALQPRREFAY